MALTLSNLPNELISGTFLAGLVPHTRAKLDIPDDSANIRFLTTISAVCSLWRDIALSTQDLWTTITYECHASSGGRTECLEAFLARSRNASIFLHVAFPRDSTVHRDIQRIHSILEPHVWRCRSFAIISEQYVGFQRFFFPLPGRMERLEEFALLEVGGGDAGPTTLFDENSALLLRRLTIHSTSTRGVPFTTDHIPTNTLTHLDLTISAIMHGQIVQFLRQCTAVVWLRFRVSSRIQLPSAFEPISLPSLKTLSVNDGLTLGFRSLFSTPNLMMLHLRSPLPLRQPPAPPNLPPLPIETVKCTSQNLLQLHPCFSAFPSVKKLTIRGCFYILNLPKCLAGFPEDNNPLQKIESSESRETHILPQLEYLEIVQCEHRRSCMGQWLKMLLIRRACLFVSIDVQSFGPPSSETEGTTMEMLKAQFGLRFTVLGDLDG